MSQILPRRFSSTCARIGLLASLVALTAPSVCQESAVDSADQPFSIVSLPTVDENLFALRFLAEVYSEWPDLHGDRSKLHEWFSGSRNAVSEMRGTIHARHLDADLEGLYSDCLEYMSGTEAYLDKLQLIENQKNAGSLSDLASSTWDGYKVRNDVASTAEHITSPENAADAGNLVGAADGLIQFYNKSQQRDASARAAINLESSKLEDKWTSVDQALRISARKMTARYGWSSGEAGFDGFQNARLDELVQRSPRDPFLQARYGDQLVRNAKSGNDCVPAINAYLTAVRLVPPDGIYDELRFQFLEEAMNAAVNGALLDSGGDYSGHPAASFNAVKLSRTYLSVNQSDPSGIGHIQLARSLAFAGRYQEALYSAQAAFNTDHRWNTDPGFCIRYSKLMSLTNDQAQAVNWMERAFQFGFTDIKDIRTSADFSALRSQRPNEFQDITTVKASWNVKFGSVMDDIVIQNDSKFDLTHAKLAVHIRKGSQVWDRVAKCDYIQSGHSCEDDDVFSIPGNSYDEATASISSDQD